MTGGWPPAELIEAARRIVLECPNCNGPGAVHWSVPGTGRWVADIWHAGNCPVRWHARNRRAAERDIADALAALLHLADYDVSGRLILARHRAAA